MNDPETRLRELRARITAATRDRLRAETARDAAEARARDARQALVDEFGIHTVTDAKQLLEQLEQELLHRLDALEAALDRIGA